MKLSYFMSKKYLEEDYKNKCNDLNLIYIGYHKDENKIKGTIIDFVCPRHEQKGVQSSPWNHFRQSSLGCPYCSGRYKTNKDFEEQLAAKGIEMISEYRRCDEPVLFKCKRCGCEWKARVSDVLKKDRVGCPDCAKKQKADKRRKTLEQFKEDLGKVNPDIAVIGEYLGAHKKIKCKCMICGTIWDAYPANLLNKSAGCPYCNMSTGEKAMLDTLTELGISYISQYPIYYGKHKKPLRYDAYNEEYNVAFEYNGEQHYHPVDFAGNGEEWANEQFKDAQERDASKLAYSKEHNIPVIIIPYWERNNMKEIIKSELKELNLKLVS